MFLVPSLQHFFIHADHWSDSLKKINTGHHNVHVCTRKAWQKGVETNFCSISKLIKYSNNTVKAHLCGSLNPLKLLTGGKTVIVRQHSCIYTQMFTIYITSEFCLLMIHTFKVHTNNIFNGNVT